jgi:hypothetical protein
MGGGPTLKILKTRIAGRGADQGMIIIMLRIGEDCWLTRGGCPYSICSSIFSNAFLAKKILVADLYIFSIKQAYIGRLQ